MSISLFRSNGEVPKPVVLVGANGSGKTILLSHIVNGLASAKDHAFPGNPKVEQGKVFKIRNNAYIKTGSEAYFAKVDFGDGWFMGEMRSRRLKRDYENIPDDIPDGDAKSNGGKCRRTLTTIFFRIFSTPRQTMYAKRLQIAAPYTSRLTGLRSLLG